MKGTAVYKIDKGRVEKAAFIKRQSDKALIHTSQRYQNVFNNAGFSFKLEKKYLPVLTESDAVSKIDFPSISIGIAPFAAHKSKEWGIDNIKELIKKINEKHSVHFYLFGGGKQEIQQLDKLASSFDNVTNLAGKFSLKEEIQLLRKLSSFIGMDSGNAHIAALTGIPVISIWGGTHPKLGFKPMYQTDENCILPKINVLNNCPFSVYGTSKPQLKESPYFCIRFVEVQQVMERLSI
jgi:ADP-heptose:LPS heptosyltransferase